MKDLAVAGVQYNSTIENYTTSFEVMTGSADKAAEVVARLKKIGAETPFELPQLAETTQLLMNYGFTADEAIDRMNMLGDISQGNADKMNRIATAYGQMSSAGKVSLEDVKQMIEAGFNPLQEISQSTGESMESLYDRISKGTLSVDEITESMQRSTSEGGKYFQSMEKQSKTFSGQMSTLKDDAQSLLGDVCEPISDTLVNEFLPNAIDFVEKLSEAFQENGFQGIADVLSDTSPVLAGIVDSFKFMAEHIDTILAIIVPLTAAFIAYKTAIAISSIITGVTTALNGMTLAQYALNLAMSLNPIGIVIALIVALVAAFIWLWNINDEFRQFWIDCWQGIKDFFKDAWDSICQFCTETIPNLIKNIGDWFSELPGRIWKWLLNCVDKVKDWKDKLKEKAHDAVESMKDKVVDTIKDLPEKFKNIGADLAKGLWNGINDKVEWIKDKIKGFGDAVLDSIKDTLDIHSPSKKFKWVGQMCVEGFEEPLEEYNPYETLNASMKVNVGTLQADFISNGSTSPYIDYDSIGYSVARAFCDMGMTMKLDGRTVGRIVRSYV